MNRTKTHRAKTYIQKFLLYWRLHSSYEVRRKFNDGTLRTYNVAVDYRKRHVTRSVAVFNVTLKSRTGESG